MTTSAGGGSERREQIFALLFVALSLLASAPVWIVRYPPLQDLPDHLSTIRVIHSLHDPAFAFERDFLVSFRQTPYVAYYLLADALAYVLGVRGANVLLMSVYLSGTPLALRAFLRATGRDPRAAILVFPLLYNMLWALGLLPFMFGIPILFLALALATVHLERPSRRSALALGGAALLLLLTHLVPFTIFSFGLLTLLPWRDLRRALRSALPVVPALAFAAWYALFTRTGAVLRGGAVTPAPSTAECIARAYSWTIAIFRSSLDEWCFIAFVMLLLAAFGLGGSREPARIGRLFFLVPMACFLATFLTPDGRGSIMLVSQRFPMLFLFTLLPCVPWPGGERVGWAFTAAAGALAVAAVVTVTWSFVEIEAHELGDFDEALAVMEPQRRVAGLVFDRGSSVLRTVPFVLFVDYYQVEKGGVVEFSPFGKEHNPVDFKPGRAPPTGAPPPADWLPERVGIDKLYPYFDYVLVRGEGFHPPPGTYRRTWQGSRWEVWSREPEALP